MVCAEVGYYSLSFAADLRDPQRGIVRLVTRVAEQGSALVENARVTVTLSRSHSRRYRAPVKMTHAGNGRYAATVGPLEQGDWSAEVAFTTHAGDTVKQKFRFRLPAPDKGRATRSRSAVTGASPRR